MRPAANPGGAGQSQATGGANPPKTGDGFVEVELEVPDGAAGGPVGGSDKPKESGKKGGVSESQFERRLILPDVSFLVYELIQDDECESAESGINERFLGPFYHLAVFDRLKSFG